MSAGAQIKDRVQLQEDAEMQNNAMSTGWRLGLGTLALSGLATALYRASRDPGRDADDPYAELYDVNTMGQEPQPYYRKKRRKEQGKVASTMAEKVQAASNNTPPPQFTNIPHNVWSDAPRTGGRGADYKSIWDVPTFLPITAASVAGGAWLGKSLGDRLGYAIRGYPAKRRARQAQKEFEETVAELEIGRAHV
jgi:hypothetical protein